MSQEPYEQTHARAEVDAGHKDAKWYLDLCQEKGWKADKRLAELDCSLRIIISDELWATVNSMPARRDGKSHLGIDKMHSCFARTGDGETILTLISSHSAIDNARAEERESILAYLQSVSDTAKNNIVAQVGLQQEPSYTEERRRWLEELVWEERKARQFIAGIRALGTRATEEIGGSHSDDLAVDRFATAMKAKLAKKRADGRGGWDDKTQCSAERLSALLREHIAKGDPVDVGNLAMMLHQRGERIAQAETEGL